jgi:hypothetical protein
MGSHSHSAPCSDGGRAWILFSSGIQVDKPLVAMTTSRVGGRKGIPSVTVPEPSIGGYVTEVQGRHNLSNKGNALSGIRLFFFILEV